MNCPYCIKVIGKEDTKYHLNFNTLKQVYRCSRCDTSGRLSDLKELNLITDNNKKTDLESIKNKIKGLFNKRTNLDFDLETISWPLNEEKSPIAYNYMKVRGFADEDIFKYSLRVGIPYFDEGKGYLVQKWRGRILFPFMDNNQRCVYIVGRTYIGADPRYLNSEGTKSTLVYNLQNVTGDTCIICEGIVSSIKAQKATGVPAVALLGKSSSKYQLSLIRSKASTIYLSLDSDTIPSDKEKIIKELIKLGAKVKLITLPYKELGDRKLKDPDDYFLIYNDLFKSAEEISVFRPSTNNILFT